LPSVVTDFSQIISCLGDGGISKFGETGGNSIIV